MSHLIPSLFEKAAKSSATTVDVQYAYLGCLFQISCKCREERWERVKFALLRLRGNWSLWPLAVPSVTEDGGDVYVAINNSIIGPLMMSPFACVGAFSCHCAPHSDRR